MPGKVLSASKNDSNRRHKQMNKQGRCRCKLCLSLHIPWWLYSWWWEWNFLWYQVLACILPFINTNLMPLLVVWSGCIDLYLIKNSFLWLPGGKSIRQLFSADQKWRGADEVLQILWGGGLLIYFLHEVQVSFITPYSFLISSRRQHLLLESGYKHCREDIQLQSIQGINNAPYNTF